MSVLSSASRDMPAGATARSCSTAFIAPSGSPDDAIAPPPKPPTPDALKGQTESEGEGGEGVGAGARGAREMCRARANRSPPLASFFPVFPAAFDSQLPAPEAAAATVDPISPNPRRVAPAASAAARD